MKGLSWLAAAPLLVAVLGSSGCTQNGNMMAGGSSCNDPAASTAEKQLCRDNAKFNNTVLGGVAVGAGAGFAAGFGACMAAGGKLTQCLEWGAVGAGAGAVVGGVSGYEIAKQEEASKQKIRVIDAETKDVQAENAELQNDVQAAQSAVGERSAQLEQLNDRLKSGQITLAQAQAERTQAMQDKANLDHLISAAEKRRAEYQKAAADSKQSSPAFDAQIAEMNHEIEQLTQQRDALDHALSISSVS